MNILIIGSGSTGTNVARTLTPSHNVTIIEKNTKNIRHSLAPDATWILGDACDIPTLTIAQAADADILIALSGDDKTNLVTCLLAKSEFGIPTTLARVNNRKNDFLFTDSWGVDKHFSTPELVVSLISNIIDQTTFNHLHTFSSQARLLSTTITADSPAAGMTQSELPLPPTITLSGVLRNGMPMNVKDSPFMEGDEIILLCAHDSDEDINIIEPLFTPLDQ
ncbi:MAG: TrkA family potassium uptake protein [Actinomycetaceae bacterium]|nr:TrkA family potassium uptake protein [Actinomycetaceae bacterium]